MISMTMAPMELVPPIDMVSIGILLPFLDLLFFLSSYFIHISFTPMPTLLSFVSLKIENCKKYIQARTGAML